MISCIFDLFYSQCLKPAFDLLLTYFNVFGVRGPLGGLCFLILALELRAKQFMDMRINTFISATNPPLFLGVDACRDLGEGQL